MRYEVKYYDKQGKRLRRSAEIQGPLSVKKLRLLERTARLMGAIRFVIQIQLTKSGVVA